MKNNPILPESSKDQLISLYRAALASGVSKEELDEKVIKQIARLKISSRVELKEENQRLLGIKKSLPLAVRIGAFFVPLGFLGVGMYLITAALGPIAYAYLTTGIFLQSDQLLSPIPREQVIDVTPIIINQAHAENRLSERTSRTASTPRIINEELDFTNLSNWFNAGALPDIVSENSQAETTAMEYSLEIPSLNIYNAKVKIGGFDLNESLIAYAGTAMPGELGSPVIFGHSVLRQFYNPHEKNPNRYNSIFSTIMTMKNGDLIYLSHDDIRYTYMVIDKTEVQPEDVFILTQRYDIRQLKLVTCTPEGTYLRRGVLTAQLVEID